MQQSKAELIQLSQSTIKNKDAGLRWLTKNGLIIPGETTTIATLTMALLCVSNGKYELKEMINGTRAVALCLESIHQDAKVEKMVRRITADIETSLKAIGNKFINVIKDNIVHAFIRNQKQNNQMEQLTTPQSNPIQW